MASNPTLNPSTFDVIKLRGESVTINSQNLTVLSRDPDGNVLLARGTATISDGASGYAKGALYIDTDVASGTSGLYENVGTTTSCNFDLVAGAGGGGGGQSLDSVYDIGQSISVDAGAVTLNDATTGALDTLDLVLTGAKSGDAINISMDAATTGSAIEIDMNLAIAASALFIDNGATARTGSDILVTSDSTGAHSVIDINASGSGASIGFDWQGSYNGSPAGHVFKLTFDANDNLDTEVMQIDTNTGDRGIMFDFNFGHTDSGTTSHIFDIDVSAILDSNIFDFATSAACTGNFINAVMDNAVAMTALRITGAGVRTQPFIELIGTQTGSANMVDFSADGAFTGHVIDMDLTTAVGAAGLTVTGAGARTEDIFQINDSSTSNSHVFDVNISGVNTGNVFDVALSAAATGIVLNVDLDAGVAAQAFKFDAGGGIRTAAMGLVTLDGSGASAGATFMDINVTATGATASGVFDIDVSGVYTGSVLDIVYSAAATGDAINMDLTSAVAAKAMIVTAAGARNDDIFEINDSSTGSAHIFDVNMSGIYTGNILDITFATAAATSSAIKLAMGTNVAGQAIEITSAATGTSGEGSALDVEHTGNLGAGASLVDIHSTGSPSSTSYLMKLTQDTGAGSAGAYGLYVSTTGTNVEAIKVDDGAVVFDETLTVTGQTTLGTVLYKDLTEVVTTTNVITAAETGSVFFLNSATEFVSTLPAPAAGLHFTFIVTAAPSGASYTVVTNASANIIVGQQVNAAGAAGDTGTSDDTITFVDGQSVVGDKVEVFCDGTNWFAYATCAVAAGITFTTAS